MSDLGNSQAPHEVMTHTNDPMNLLTVELVRRSKGRASRDALERFESAGIDTFGAQDLEEMTDRFHGAGPNDRAVKESLNALIGLAPHDEEAGLVVLVALRPALYGMVPRNTSQHVSSDEVRTDLLGFAWESILEAAELHPDKRTSTVLSATATKIRTTQRRWARHAERPEPLEVAADIADPHPAVEIWPEESLLRAYRAGVLRRSDVDLIIYTRLDDGDLADIALQSGVPYPRLQKQRRRAEAALREFMEAETQR